jgi:hypothetical protein
MAIVLAPAASWVPSIVSFAVLDAGIPLPAARFDKTARVPPFAVTVIVPVGATPTLVVLIKTVKVVDAEEGKEAVDTELMRVVPVCTTVKGTATLLLAL